MNAKQEEKTDAMFPSPEHRQLFSDKVRLCGVHTIDIQFSGSGDDGTIQDPVFLNSAGEDISERVGAVTIPWPGRETSTWNPGTASWDVRSASDQPEDTSLKEIVAAMADAALTATGIDWYNNEGGQGEFTFTFTADGMEVTLHVGANFTTTTDHHFEY